MTALFLLLAALAMLAGVSRVMFYQWRTGSLRWDRQVSDTAKSIVGGICVLVIGAALVVFGLDATVSAAPYLIGATTLAWLSYKGLDLLFIRDDAPRVIQHANGRRAVVDRERYRPLPPPRTEK